MTRAEQIIEAGIEYTMQNNPVCIGGDNFYEQAKEFNRNRSFEAGAEWADENPKSPWISAKDKLPYNNPDLTYFGFTNRVLVRTKDGDLFVAYMKKNKDDKWIWYNDIDDIFDLPLCITHWMPIPELE